MPEDPREEKRPNDAAARAAMIGRIATSEAEEALIVKIAAAELGRRGGMARAERMSPERRAEIARKAAAKRWRKET